MNHLRDETSPYLLQHVKNPVDWYPWGEEALARARELDRPIFLSIGYSACHWCHVMERESFENPEIAALMNEYFVNIKVDREERPDLDDFYMAAVQRMTGSGGWPMSVFLTPDLKPFYGGTYFPPRSAYGRPGFPDVLKQMHQAWNEKRDLVEGQADKLLEMLRAQSEGDFSGEPPGAAVLRQAVEFSEESADRTYGGFSPPPQYAPKFPHVTQLTFLLRHGKANGDDGALEAVTTALDQMARGGIYDQVGGGFARYSVDREWTVPHFEKMLYDNSQLALLYTEAWQALGDPFYRDIAREVLDYVLREMTSPEGGFYSTTDADSEGEEGKFFVWSREELEEVCGDDRDVAVAWYGVTDQGNFEGHNILTARNTLAEVAKVTKRSEDEVLAAIERCRAKLYERREQRIHPLLDDKILSSWNGLMLRAFAVASRVFEEPKYLAAAQRNAEFLLTRMRQEDGTLFRTRRGDRSHLDAYLEDYAFVAQGLLDLFEADADPRWLKAAQELQAHADEHFDDPRGGYFHTADDGEELPARFSDPTESSLPSDIGVALLNLARLGLLEGDPAKLEHARAGLSRYSQMIHRYPVGFCQMLLVIDFLESSPSEVYVAGDASDERVDAELTRLRRQWPPYRVFVHVDAENRATLEELLPAARGKTPIDGAAAVYLCHEGVCERPRVLQ